MNGAGRGLPARLWRRWLAIGLSFLLLFWLPIEDVGLIPVLIFSAALCCLGAAGVLFSPPARTFASWRVLPAGWRRAESWPGAALVISSALAGLMIPPIALLLMAFKSGLHGHPAPDFTPAQVIAVLRSIPIWGLSGLLLGLGAALLRAARLR